MKSHCSERCTQETRNLLRTAETGHNEGDRDGVSKSETEKWRAGERNKWQSKGQEKVHLSLCAFVCACVDV